MKRLTTATPTPNQALPHTQVLIHSLDIINSINDGSPLSPRRATISGSRERDDFESFIFTDCGETGNREIGSGCAVDPDEGKSVWGAGDEIFDDAAVWKCQLLSHLVYMIYFEVVKLWWQWGG
jgi:hypothetical protein